MIELIENNRAELATLCERYHVSRLELFGSATDPSRFDAAKSDVDFLVAFLPLEPGQHADAYFGLLEGLRELLGRPVDLVVDRAIRNRYFRQAVDHSRTVVYAA
ncbi:MAG: hypothetical protein RL885_21055 [Planctomycetota bacterium]